MNLTRPAYFDTATLDRPPSGWFAKFWTWNIVAGSGLLAAVLTVVYPLAGIGVAVSIVLLLLIIRIPVFLLVLFGFALGMPFQVSLASIPVNAADGIIVLWLIYALFIAKRRPSQADASVDHQDNLAIYLGGNPINGSGNLSAGKLQATRSHNRMVRSVTIGPQRLRADASFLASGGGGSADGNTLHVRYRWRNRIRE